MIRDCTSTPLLDYEPETGYLILTNGERRQIVCRVGPDLCLYLWWKHGGGYEIPVYLEEFIGQIRHAITE